MENLKKSNELLEAIINGTAFDSETGIIWQHWLEEISKQVDINNIELSALANDYKNKSNCNLPQVSNRYEVRDWMGGQLYEFDNYDDAKKKYDEIYKDTHNDECDIQLYNVLHDFSNIEEQK